MRPARPSRKPPLQDIVPEEGPVRRQEQVDGAGAATRGVFLPRPQGGVAVDLPQVVADVAVRVVGHLGRRRPSGPRTRTDSCTSSPSQRARRRSKRRTWGSGHQSVATHPAAEVEGGTGDPVARAWRSPGARSAWISSRRAGVMRSSASRASTQSLRAASTATLRWATKPGQGAFTMHPRPRLAGDELRAVGGARVHHHDLVAEAHAVDRVPEHVLLVLCDEDRGERDHAAASITGLP